MSRIFERVVLSGLAAFTLGACGPSKPETTTTPRVITQVVPGQPASVETPTIFEPTSSILPEATPAATGNPESEATPEVTEPEIIAPYTYQANSPLAVGITKEEKIEGPNQSLDTSNLTVEVQPDGRVRVTDNKGTVAMLNNNLMVENPSQTRTEDGYAVYVQILAQPTRATQVKDGYLTVFDIPAGTVVAVVDRSNPSNVDATIGRTHNPADIVMLPRTDVVVN